MKRQKSSEESFEECLERGKLKAKEEKLQKRFDETKLALVIVGAVFMGLLVIAPWAGAKNAINTFYAFSMIGVGLVTGFISLRYEALRERLREPETIFPATTRIPYMVDGKIIFIPMPPLFHNHFEGGL